MAASVSLVTRAEAKEWLNIASATTTYDDFIDKCILRASEAAERYCNRSFNTGTYTEKHNGDDSQFLIVKNPPITSITSIAVVVDSTSTTINSTSYTFDAQSGIISFVNGADIRVPPYWTGDRSDCRRFAEYPNWPKAFQNITIVYVGGYATIPDDLKQAGLYMISDLYGQRGRDTSVVSEQLGRYSYQRSAMTADQLVAGVVSPTIAALLRPFRREVWAL